MKQYLLLPLLFVVFLASCDSSTEVPTDGNSLILSADTLYLSKAEGTKMLDLTLSCGCMFTVEVTSLVGDTKTIETTPLEAMDVKRDKHTIAFQYRPTTLTSSSTLRLNFLAKKSPYSYTKSVVVKAVN